MKTRLFLWVCLGAVLVLSGCLEMEERTEFKTDNSGIYSLAVDAGKMLGQLKMLGGAEQLHELDKRDSILPFSTMIALDSTLTPQDKALVKDGFTRIHVNEEKNELQVTLSAPFEQASDIARMRYVFFKMINNRSKSPLPGIENPLIAAGGLSILDMSSYGLVFSSQVGALSSTITDTVSFKKRLQQDNMLQQMRQVAQFMNVPVVYKHIIHLPSPAKSVTGNRATVDANRRTVIVNNSFADIFDSPQGLQYSVTW